MSGWNAVRGGSVGAPATSQSEGGAVTRPGDARQAVALLDDWCEDVAAVTGQKVEKVAPRVVSFVAVALLVAGNVVDLAYVHEQLLTNAGDIAR